MNVLNVYVYECPALPYDKTEKIETGQLIHYPISSNKLKCNLDIFII